MDERISPCTSASIERAARILRDGGLVVFPTETVYGLGGDATSDAAVARIYEAKGRPQDNPLIAHVGSIEQARRIAETNDTSEVLMARYWPGPLTIVMRSRGDVCSSARAGLPTVAVRMPMNAAALMLIRASGIPIAAPSANTSGRPSPTRAQDAADDLGDRVDMVLDGGSTSIGIESTVVDATGPRLAILREGAVTMEMLSQLADLDGEHRPERSPGTRHRHYAPRIPLIAREEWDGASELRGARYAYIGTKSAAADGAAACEIFADVDEYARGLYSALRRLEGSADFIAAELPPDRGIGRALRDRILRASGRTS